MSRLFSLILVVFVTLGTEARGQTGDVHGELAVAFVRCLTDADISAGHDAESAPLGLHYIHFDRIYTVNVFLVREDGFHVPSYKVGVDDDCNVFYFDNPRCPLVGSQGDTSYCRVVSFRGDVHENKSDIDELLSRILRLIVPGVAPFDVEVHLIGEWTPDDTYSGAASIRDMHTSRVYMIVDFIWYDEGRLYIRNQE